MGMAEKASTATGPPAAPPPEPPRDTEIRAPEHTLVPVDGQSSQDRSVDKEDLMKLVPVLMEDAADGNLDSVRQILEVDARCPNLRIVEQRTTRVAQLCITLRWKDSSR